jgi:hypothetical protein
MHRQAGIVAGDHQLAAQGQDRRCGAGYDVKGNGFVVAVEIGADGVCKTQIRSPISQTTFTNRKSLILQRTQKVVKLFKFCKYTILYRTADCQPPRA